MKNLKTPFILRKWVVTTISIAFGATMGGLLCSLGQSAGEYRGRTKSNEECYAALRNLKNEPEQG